jgi:hypothetical protein
VDSSRGPELWSSSEQCSPRQNGPYDHSGSKWYQERLQQSVVQAGATQAVVVVELTVLPAGVATGEGVEPIAATEQDGESSTSADEVGW